MSFLGTEDPLAGVYGPQRFRAAYVAARRRLDAIAPERRTHGAYTACDELLTAAREAARPWWRNMLRRPTRWQKMYVAWDCLHQFDRAILPLLSRDERAALWATARAEARHKLRGWRDEAVDALIQAGDAAFDDTTEIEGASARRRYAGSIDAYLSAPPEAHADAGTASLREVMQHLHTQSQNTFRKIDMVAHALPVLLVVLLLAVGGLLWLAGGNWLDWLGLDPEQPDVAPAVFLGVLGGLLGGVISMVIGLGRVDLASSVPELRLSRITLLIRPLFGAAVAIPVALAANADVVQVNGISAPMTVFLLAIAAGFSERFFLSLIERVGGKR
jgi:hypothetical protein